MVVSLAASLVAGGATAQTYQGQPGYNQGGYNQGQPGYNQGGYNQGQPGYNQGQPGYNQGQPGYNQGGYNQGQPGYQGGYNQGPPPPPPEPPAGDILGVRFAPLWWLIAGRPSLEVEYKLLDMLTVELTPMVATQPLITNDYDQSGGGLGVGAGIWLGGEAFEGYVLRPLMQLNVMKYTANYDGKYFPDDGELLEFKHTEFRVGGMLESHYRVNFFVIAWGFGALVDTRAEAKDRVLRVSKEDTVAIDEFGGLAPKVDIVGRLSLGFVF